jgi:hypothetical protein
MRSTHVPLLLAVAALCCSRAPAPGKEDLRKGQHLERPFKAPGVCFGKPSKCVSDAQCAPPFSLCQEGACCSGEIDPATCECKCGDGPACRAGELCCEPADSILGHSQKDEAEEKGRRCRPVHECFGEG